MNKKILAWDLGATKCAAAIVEYDQKTQQLNCKQTASIKIRECHSLPELCTQLENALQMNVAEVDAICIGAAGQYDGKILHLDKDGAHSGYPYPMPFAQLAKQNNWPKFAIIHDYSPVVCATFTDYINESSHVKRLNQAEINAYGRRVALGVGTGVGVKDGILFANGDFWLGTNEMGHIGVTTPPLAEKIYQERHHELIKFLRSEKLLPENEPITFEKLLAGAGIVRIHSFFDRTAAHKTPEEIGELVRNGMADETLATFAWYLGLLIGTVQLSFMPDGGIWLTGGVLANHNEVFACEEFFEGIACSPNYLNLRQQFPLGVFQGNKHAFLGSAYYASKRLL